MLCSLHDAIDLETLGCPTVVLVTDVFHQTAIAHAEHLGLPDVRIVAIANPLSGISDEEVTQRARAVLPDVVAGLTMQGEK